MQKYTLADKYQKASLTVEAALVLPVFLYFMLAFLYFIQIFTVQEQIQSAITKLGLRLAKAAYVFQDFPTMEEALSFDFTVFDNEYDLSLDELADTALSSSTLKLFARQYLDAEQINRSCIKGGFDGISFCGSSIFDSGNDIDIAVSYKVHLPIKIFLLDDMQMVQRVRLRKWTGYEVSAVYQKEEKDNQEGSEIVYITETGSVYHKDRNCTHIKLNVTAVQGIPTGLRNENGAKYYPCETCCTGKEDSFATFYITSDGTRYHTRRDCPGIKRSVKAIKLSEAGNRTPCKRCCD